MWAWIQADIDLRTFCQPYFPSPHSPASYMGALWSIWHAPSIKPWYRKVDKRKRVCHGASMMYACLRLCHFSLKRLQQWKLISKLKSFISMNPTLFTPLLNDSNWFGVPIQSLRVDCRSSLYFECASSNDCNRDDEWWMGIQYLAGSRYFNKKLKWRHTTNPTLWHFPWELLMSPIDKVSHTACYAL